MKIRLVEVTEKPLLLTHLNDAEEITELFEDNLLAALDNDDNQTPLYNKVMLCAELASKYIEVGYRHAAIATLKRMEPLYFELLGNLSGTVDDEIIDLLVSAYLKCGCVEDARWIAALTARTLAERLASTEEQMNTLNSWLCDQFALEIDAFERRQEQKAVRMRHLKVCGNTCAVDESFVIDLSSRRNPLKGA